ncbi:hypothetical protein [Shewanella gaetbuli]|uniref:DUF5683 domain-containing protein n=1 Tax=Shewanella gaetbuli TaxID=220752 RepID=A0A9X2CKZ2_9GAMM|nr:hypothetical protein [Shewanella gaetbuli]MCL1142129.1 hypothetical protein [Shewanella gaetbuli]
MTEHHASSQTPSITRSLKAAMMSALICPGSGQMWLGKKWPGIGFIIVSLVSLIAIFKYTIDQAQVVADKIVAGEIPLEYYAIYQQVTQITQNGDTWVIWVTWLFAGNWLFSIIHAYWLGRKP